MFNNLYDMFFTKSYDSSSIYRRTNILHSALCAKINVCSKTKISVHNDKAKIISFPVYAFVSKHQVLPAAAAATCCAWPLVNTPEDMT